jgi:hypothetical protein
MHKTHLLNVSGSSTDRVGEVDGTSGTAHPTNKCLARTLTGSHPEWPVQGLHKGIVKSNNSIECHSLFVAVTRYCMVESLMVTARNRFFVVWGFTLYAPPAEFIAQIWREICGDAMYCSPLPPPHPVSHNDTREPPLSNIVNFFQQSTGRQCLNWAFNLSKQNTTNERTVYNTMQFKTTTFISIYLPQQDVHQNEKCRYVDNNNTNNNMP